MDKPYHFRQGCRFYKGRVLVFIWVIFFMSLTLPVSRASEDSEKQEPIRLNFGIDREMLQGHDMKDVVSATNIWLEWAGTRFNIKPKTIIYENVDSMIADYKDHAVDLIILTSINYLTFEERTGIKPTLGPTGLINNSVFVSYLLVVKNDPGVSSLSDIKHKTLSLQNMSDLERLFLNTELLKAGLEEIDDFFGKVLVQVKSSRTVLDVFFGRANACIVPEYVYQTMIDLNPQLGKKTKVLARSKGLLPTTSFLHMRADPRLTEVVDKIMPEFTKSEKWQQMLLMFKVNQIAWSKHPDLDEVKALISEYKALKGATTK